MSNCHGYTDTHGNRVKCPHSGYTGESPEVMDRQISNGKYRPLCRDCWDKLMATTGRYIGRQERATEPPTFDYTLPTRNHYGENDYGAFHEYDGGERVEIEGDD